MSALGNVGTGNLTTVMVKEEPSLEGTIVTGIPYWLRRNRAFFQRLPNFVESDFANAVEDGLSKEVFHTAAGILACELDCTNIGALLKGFMGETTTTGPTDTTVYKHVFQPGLTTLKSYKIFQDVGGLSTPLNENFVGMALDRIAIIANLLETVKVETVWLGITDEDGSFPAITGATQANPCEITAAAHGLTTGDTIKIASVGGMTDLNGNEYTVTRTAANTFTLDSTNSTGYGAYTSGGTFKFPQGDSVYAAENQTVSFKDEAGNAAVKFYLGTAGATTISAMTPWTDPYYGRVDFARNRKVDNFRSDGTGKSAGISDGKIMTNINLITTLTTNHEYATFRAGTEKSFGMRLDTGTLVTGAAATNFVLDIIFPRVELTNYDANVDGKGTILPAVNIKPQKDATAGYSVSMELFNATSSYPDST